MISKRILPIWPYIPCMSPLKKDKTMKHIDDLKVGDIVKFDRCIGEYRGRFDNINIAMVLVNNRLYYVPYDKIEQL